MAIGFRLIQIAVSDPEQARRFYFDTLGFEEDENSTSAQVPALKTEHGFPILLYPGKPTKRDYPDDCSPVLIIKVDDIDNKVAQLKEKGVEFIPIAWSKEESGIGVCPFGRFIAFRDPFGNVHELLQAI